MAPIHLETTRPPLKFAAETAQTPETTAAAGLSPASSLSSAASHAASPPPTPPILHSSPPPCHAVFPLPCTNKIVISTDAARAVCGSAVEKSAFLLNPLDLLRTKTVI